MDISNKSLIKDKCYINGEWINSYNKDIIEVNNPSTLKIIGKVPKCGKEETKFAISKANEAWSGWKGKTALERSVLLKKWFYLIEKNKEDLAKIMTFEQGKPIAESRAEISYGASFVEWFAEEAKRIYGDTIPDRFSDRRIIVLKQPIGIVAAITPWNFPSSMITRKCAPALAVGCPVVIKPASQTPFSALALGVLAEEAGFPKGVINIITGDAKEIGSEMSYNPIVRKLSFTGSTEVGKVLLSQCSSTVKKVSMELGGHAPFIVFDDANIDEAVTGAIQSKFRNTGQTCVCANRLFVHEKVYDEFLKKFVKAVSEMEVGDGFTEGIVSGPLIDEYSLEKVKEHVQDAVNKGAKIAIGGEIHKLGGNFYLPTILSDVSIKSKITNEETFGPVAPVYKFSKDEEVIKMANDTPYGLASYFYSRDIGRIWKVAEELEYGIVSVNTGLPSKAEIPFGGVKESGLGREGSKYGIDDFLEIKYIQMAGI
ncbi:MAG: Glutarate-semialdehyde dehydrogenase DavD [Alphaproteobacteria bacterium MarineAlpha5_Bin8]|nr:MAG: Glutarate-semialdehyde dehydrogenase DavD [Alphaproteobacteria bacterium MarineAlpha5_Bin7]PPR47170.1 MAG: Glutarate-semialdehyde dehydrogenase DavD [Alphaproteobacteria bacterium MarineAlpha5_Bin8]PPR54192.1 MAG: Glutarate-semialdehyde dehydrogenase DavD [Alphaproteobacteria bacterium MarineAlpha5_Bin6]|tara:strand:+ start:3744 stop:5195 length:1452 start_codon:yes stop_codon:yes gene_type:complete